MKTYEKPEVKVEIFLTEEIATGSKPGTTSGVIDETNDW